MSVSSRSLERCTISFTAKGADTWSGCSRSCAASSALMRVNHSPGATAGRAFSAGNEPTMPALSHQQIYRELGRLEEAGWVESMPVPEGPGRQRAYQVLPPSR